MHARLIRRAVSFAAFVACSSIGLTSFAEGPYRWRAQEGETHGSQVASSEWLPIFIGASSGVVIGGLVGTGFDSHQPPVLGALLGGGIGGITGGGGGAWFIRSIREQDTRFAGAVTGLGLGLGLGTVLFDATGSVPGKIAAIVLLPTMGAFAGRSLAIHFGGERTPEGSSPLQPTVSMTPTIAPLYGNGTGAHGMTVGLNGVFF